ncbi:MAG: hypothetical protein CMM15_10640 [Rhodospirillaceae bacterium]|nr:hypothetical protein [Rhodospirillaceae bacterium]OUX68025.1 MAG: hypothetical protein CBD38_00975 [bacterium TMED178]
MLSFYLHVSFLIGVLGWTPIGSIRNLNAVQRIKVDQQDYVVWRKEKNHYVVQDNHCVHRHAPLSEGRVVDMMLECPYHGWRYNAEGNVVRIPQSRSSSTKCITSYTTKILGDILWANLPLSIGYDMDIFEKTIEEDSVVCNASIPYQREVPYSWNYLLENLFDPAHVPFAHHGMQSRRSDGMPIPMQLVHYTPDKLVVLFEDQCMNEKRDGRIEFFGPYLYCLSFRQANIWKRNMTILCVPVEVGRTRIFIIPEKNFTTSERREQHEFTNTFFNTDDYLVHQQEIYHGRSRTPYYMPTSSDAGIRQLHKWIARFFSEWMFQNVQEKTKAEALDNFENHIKFCKDCQK